MDNTQIGNLNQNNKNTSSKQNLDNLRNGETKEGPFFQFEECPHKDFNCKFRDIAGNCIWETCVVDNVNPPQVELWYFKCAICGLEDAVKPQEMRVPFCRSCLKRMNNVEKLPHTCRYCGKTINSPAAFMFSGICDECDNTIKEMINYYKSVGKKWWKPL